MRRAVEHLHATRRRVTAQQLASELRMPIEDVYLELVAAETSREVRLVPEQTNGYQRMLWESDLPMKPEPYRGRWSMDRGEHALR